MKLVKPAWVHHDGKPIFSIDIHPDGSRFATGGQGDDCGRIMVWNMQPVRSEKAELDKAVHKLLCKMDNHLGCVNCVRWSNGGRALASAADDKLVMVWRWSAGASASFGTTNHENWRASNILRGHNEDVLDVAWSPQDAFLASCSVDNTIIVWNANKLPEQTAILRGHSGLVKGVTWDPVGKYLASQSDDKTLRIWRTSDWKEEACVSEPFQECCGTTHVLRLNWSPDGQYVVSAHAMNNAGPTAQIIDRGTWKTSLDFVGHRKAVTCVRFNPNLLKKRLRKDREKETQYSCVAIGSRDRSVSIWLTALKRPLVLTHDLFERSILDLSWSASGMELMSCSEDGTVCYMGFTTDEVGSPISRSDKDILFRKTYGKSVFLDNSATKPQIIESSAMLNIQQQNQAKLAEESRVATAQPPSRSCSMETPKKQAINSNSTSLTPSNKQIETRTKDGKRRITPIFLAAPLDGGDVLPPSSNGISFSSSREHSTIVREKLDKLDIPTFPKTPLLDKSQLPEEGSTPPSQTMTPGADNHQSLPSESTKDKIIVHTAKRILDVNQTDSPLTTSEPPAKKKDGRGRPRKDKTLNDSRASISSVQAPVQTVQQVVEKETRIVYTNAGLDLPVPAVEKTTRVQVYSMPGSSDSLLVEVENNISVGATKLHTLRGIRGGVAMWESLLNSPILACTGNKHFTCAACTDGSLHLVATGSGCRMLPSLVLDAKVHQLRTSGNYVMAITSRGSIYIWNMQTKQVVLRNESLSAFIHDDSVKISNILLTEQGLPVISVDTGSTYTFKAELGCWVLLNNREDTLSLCSEHYSVAASASNKTNSAGPLATIQAANSRGSASRLYKASNPAVQRCATSSHLESQLTKCWALKSASEYHFWLLTYVRYLAQQGSEKRLRELCDDLLGPLHRSKSSVWEATILGHKKRKLLEECLPIIGTNLQLQRLYTEYKEQLEEIV